MGTVPVNPYMSSGMTPGANADPSGWNGMQPGSGWNGINPTPGYMGPINGMAPSASWHGLMPGGLGMIGGIPWATGYGTQNPGQYAGVGAPTSYGVGNPQGNPYQAPGFIGNINSLGSGYWNAPQYADYINTVNPNQQTPISGQPAGGPNGLQGDLSLQAPSIYAPTWAVNSPQSIMGPGGTPLPYQAQQGSQFSMNLPGGGTWTPQNFGNPITAMAAATAPGTTPGTSTVGPPSGSETPQGSTANDMANNPTPNSIVPLGGSNAPGLPYSLTDANGNPTIPIGSQPGYAQSIWNPGNPAGVGAAPYGSTQFSGTGTYPGQTLANTAPGMTNPTTGTPGTPAPTNTAGITPDQWMASSGGTPIDTTPAWQAMVQAEAMNNQSQFQNLNEAFNVSGGRFSSSFGNAAQNYWNQAALGQNAQLTAAQTAAMEAAAGRQNANMQQLSSQDFQSMMQQYQIAAGLAGQQYSTTTGAGAQAGTAEYGATTQAQLASQQIQNLWQQYMALGGQLGGTQYNQQQQTLPQYNPLLPYMLQMSGMYPGTAQSAYGPSPFSQIAGPVAQLGGAGLGAYASYLALAALACWIAEALYGVSATKTHVTRAWLNGPFKKTLLGNLLMKLYVKVGRRVAKSRRACTLLKPLFDLAVTKASLWWDSELSKGQSQWARL